MASGSAVGALFRQLDLAGLGEVAQRRVVAVGDTLLSASEPQILRRALTGWCLDEGLTAHALHSGGTDYLVVEVPAAAPAFASHQRQAMLVTARIEGHAVTTQDAESVGLSCGGLLAAQAIGAAGLLGALQTGGQVAAARDLILTIELPAGEGTGEQDLERSGGVDQDRLQQLLARTAVAIAEPGGWSMAAGSRRVRPVGVAQKGQILLRLRAQGSPGDGAIPRADSPIVRLRAALTALDDVPRPWTVTPSASAFVAAMSRELGLKQGLALRALAGRGASSALLERLPDVDTELLDAIFRPTWALTSLTSDACGAEAIVDWRPLPGAKRDAVLDQLRAALPDGIALTVLRERAGVQADLHSPLWRIIVQTLARATADQEPLTVVPIPIPGTYSALGWRQAAVPCYGLAPVTLGDGSDMLRDRRESGVKAASDGVAWGARALAEVVVRYCAEG